MSRRQFLTSTISAFACLSTSIAQEPEKKKIYLTIDDGPRNYMEEILEVLGENKAVFYIVGEQIKTKKGFELACKALTQGHILGNHSYSHPQFSKISLEKAKNEILKTDILINEAHMITEIPRTHKLFRFPYGTRNKKAEEFLKEQEFNTQFWDCDTSDWRYYSKVSPRSLDSIMKNCRQAKDSDIVLCHDKPITAKYVVPFYVNSPEYELVLPA